MYIISRTQYFCLQTQQFLICVVRFEYWTGLSLCTICLCRETCFDYEKSTTFEDNFEHQHMVAGPQSWEIQIELLFQVFFSRALTLVTT